MLARSHRAPVLVLGLAAILLPLAGCASIGNQHFYGLTSHEFAPIDRFVYRLAKPSEYQGFHRATGI